MINSIYKMRKAAILGVAFLFIFLINALPASSQGQLLDPNTITKYVDTLTVPAVMGNIGTSGDTTLYHIGMYPIAQYYSRQFPRKTIMWGYGKDSATASSPSHTILAQRHHPMKIHWTNNLIAPDGTPLKSMFPIDRTIPWADPYNEGPVFTQYDGPVPTVVHMHGAEVESSSDGHFMGWFTPEGSTVPQMKGPTFDCNPNGSNYVYNNEQSEALIWYHDHAFGIDRINVMAGLFGGCAIYDPTNPLYGPPHNIPLATAYDVPLIIQDRILDTNYQIAYYGVPSNPDVHPIWFPEFFGNTIVVNGKVWPTLYAEARHYRFRCLDGSNARFYHMYVGNADGSQYIDPRTSAAFSWLQIGTDGGYINHAVAEDNLLFAPAERSDLIFDFTGLPVGTELYLCNDAPGPYPTGTPVDNNTMFIMKIKIVPLASVDNVSLAAGDVVKPAVPSAPTPNAVRNVVLFEKEGALTGAPLAMYLDGIDMSDPRSVYKPVVGTVEQWNIINTTMDAHPMHLHLVEFQMLGRRHFNNMTGMGGYLDAFKVLNPVLPIPYDSTFHPLDVTSFYDDVFVPASGYEVSAMKDTWICPPSTVTEFLIKWRQEDDTQFGFDATKPPGYVWHCHILEHEENAMMREIHPINILPTISTGTLALDLDPSLQQAYGPVHYTNMMPMLNHWTDQSARGNDAVQMDMMKQPMFDPYGLNCRESVMFQGNPLYGHSSAFSIPYNGYISSMNTDPMNPVAESKNLFIVFSPHSLVGKQVLFETGKTTSGFNVYLNNNKLMFGLWNALERDFVMYNTSLTMGHDVTYLAHLQYNSVTKKFQAFINGTKAASSPISFQGFSMDSNATGIGCAAGGTRFQDYNVGFDFTKEYTGEMGDVILYDTYLSVPDIQRVYTYLNAKWGQNWVYPTAQAPRGSWTYFTDKDSPAMTENPTNNQHLAPAFPNPFSDESEFSVNLSDKQNVNIELYNNFGVKVATIFDGSLPKGNTMFNIDGAKLSPGMYVIKAAGDGFVESGKVILVK